MSDNMKSLVAVSSLALWPTLVMMNQALGFDPGDGVKLSPNGKDPITHKGLHTWAHPHFVEIALGKVQPVIAGIAPDMIKGLLASIYISVDMEIDGRIVQSGEHFKCAIEGLNLRRVVIDSDLII